MKSNSTQKKNLRKRKINSAIIFSSPSTTYKSSSSKNLLSTMRIAKNYQNKSQIQLKFQKNGFEPIKNISQSCRHKLLTPQDINNSIKNQEYTKIMDINLIYKSILSKIEKIIQNYNQDITKLNYILLNIDNFIDTINQEYSLKKKITMPFLYKSFTTKSEKQIKYDLESMGETKNNKILSPIKNNISNNNLLESAQTESDSYIYKRKVNKLLVKISEIERKFKIEKLKYLFCIGEYQKKIVQLEKKLNMNSIGKMPKTELKKFLCYPHYVKFDVEEEVNPKSIPMYLLRSKSSIHDNRKNTLSKSNSVVNINEDYLKKLKENNNISFEFIEEGENNNENIDNDKIDLNNIEEENYFDKEKDINFDEVKNIIELGKLKFSSSAKKMDKFFGKNKTFFLSHPKLNYIKSLNDGNKMATWKLENQINSLPKQLSKLRHLSKSQKNAIVVFPSFLNETIVNLEKLRTNKNFRSIENKFEETFKIKIKN